MSETLQVAIFDDHPLFREGVAHTLSAEPGIEVVAEGASAVEAVRVARDQVPDVVLLDLSMPGGGIAAARQIADCCPVVKTIVLTVSEDEEDVTAALRGGARAYVLKGVPARELVRVVRSVAAGEVYVTPSLAASLLGDGRGGGRGASDPLDDLTERERDILERVAAGDSNKEIAASLDLSVKTVEVHKANAMRKLGISGRIEIVKYAILQGWMQDT